ncbi:MAG: DUF1905 domain-containing protein [Bacteroidota bacterium]
MEKGKIKYDFTTKMWRHNSTGGWYFVSLPKDLSKEIREHFQWQEEGWGRMKAFAGIGEMTWESSIWFDTKMDTYILPIKADIRKRLNLEVDQEIHMNVWI